MNTDKCNNETIKSIDNLIYAMSVYNLAIGKDKESCLDTLLTTMITTCIALSTEILDMKLRNIGEQK